MTDAHKKPEWAQSKFEKKNAERVEQGLKPKRRVLRWVVLGVIVVGIIAFFVMQPAPEPVEVVEETGVVVRQLLPDEVIEIGPQVLRQTVKVTGTLEPAHLVSVAAMASGQVMSVTGRPGDTVAEGDVLAEIDRATLELQLNQQRATAEATRIQLLSARQQLERTEELARRGLASPSTLEQATTSVSALESNYAALESGVETAEIALDNATVRAPLAGIVSVRSVEPGQTISAGSPIFTIVNLEEMEFQASASVNSSALVNAGQQVEITVTGIDNTVFDGEVTRVNPVAISGTRAVPIYVAVDNPDGLLRGGMFASGQITVAQKQDAIAIPSAAVREDATGSFVLVLDGDQLARRAVEPGTEWDRGRIVEVTGLEPGDSIVAAALTGLADGDAYQIVEN